MANGKGINELLEVAYKQSEEQKQYLHSLINQIKVEVVKQEGDGSISALYSYPDEMLPFLEKFVAELKSKVVVDKPTGHLEGSNAE